ncbi:hypothetical protein CL633_01425 [bacterium]|nr:hypothetical protein [bacterium]|tara:strand:+ start:604 stop:966 length:363 start_codon:yes stop_codon:yes gene_type:complete
MKIEITQYKLPSWNTLYKGTHWTYRHKIAEEAHQLVYWAVKQQHSKNDFPYKKPVQIDYEIHYKAKRRRDVDNACVKILCDGLVLAGVLKDDSADFIPFITIKMILGQSTDKVVIKIKEL